MGKTFSFLRRAAVLLGFAAAVFTLAGSGSALAQGDLVLVDSHLFTWTDPGSQGVVLLRSRRGRARSARGVRCWAGLQRPAARLEW